MPPVPSSAFSASNWVDAIRWNASLVSKHSLRLFRQGCPRAHLQEVVEEINRRGAQASITLVTGEALEGPWRPSPALWRRDAGERTGGDDTVTLLLDMSAVASADATAVNESCSETVSVRYEWDKAMVESVTAMPVPGTVVRLGGVSRDPNSRLWSYYVETRTSKVQTLVEHTSRGEAFESETTQAKLSVRVSAAGALTDEDGNAVTLPAAGLSEGVLTQQQRRKNPDCTTDIVVTQLTPLPDSEAGSSVTKEAFVEVTGTSKANQPAAEDGVSILPDGTITEVKSDKNKFGKWDIQIVAHKPLPMALSGSSVTKEAFVEVTGTSKANQSAAQAGISILPDGTITEVKSDKNKFGKWDIQIVAHKPLPMALSGSSVTKEAFVEVTGTSKANQSAAQAGISILPDGTITEVKSDKNKFGKWDIQIVAHKPLPVALSGSSVTKEAFVEVTGTSKANQSAAEDGVAIGEDGTITEVKSDKNKFGKWDIQMVTHTPLPVSPSGSTASDEAFFSSSGTSKANQVEAEASASLAGGVITEVKSDKNKHGLWDVQRVVLTGKPVSNSEVANEASVLVTIASATQSNQSEADTTVVASPGVIQVARAQKNKFGLFDNEKTTRTAVPLSDSAVSGGVLQSEIETFTRNSPTPASPGVAAAGRINDASNNINEFGLFDTRSVIRTAYPKSATATSGGPLQSETETVVRNASSPASPGAGGTGRINDASNNINEFGLFDTRSVIRTARPLSGSATSGGPLVTEVETITRNKSGPESPGPGTAGRINDASNNLNEFGLYDTRKVMRTAVPFSGSQTTSGGPLVREQETIKRNQSRPETPGQGVDGTINDVSNNVNEFGRYDTRKVVRTAQAKGPIQFTTGGPLVTTTEKLYRNRSSVISPGAGLAGQYKDASNSLNEFGRYDGSETTRTAVARAQPVYQWPEIRGLTSRNHKVSKFVNVATVPAIPNSTKTRNVQADFSLNAFGLIDGTIVETPRFGPSTTSPGSRTFDSGKLHRSEMETVYDERTNKTYKIQTTYEYRVRAYTRSSDGDCDAGWDFFDGAKHGSSYDISRYVITFYKVTKYTKKITEIGDGIAPTETIEDSGPGAGAGSEEEEEE